MPEITIPLVGSPDLRNQDAYNTIGRGQRFIGCVFDVVKNPVTGNGKVYCSKRPGLATANTPAAGNAGVVISNDGGSTITVFNTTTGAVYKLTTAQGNIGGSNIYPAIGYGYVGDEYVWLFTTNTTGWFLAAGAASGASTFTANRTAASTTLSSVSSFTGLYVGQLLSGTGIDSLARIASMNTGAGTLEMTVAASSGAGTSTTVTRERIAKIIDADFPTSLRGPMIEIDGYVLVGSSNRIYNSDQNSVVSWAAASYLTLSSNSGDVAGVAKYKGRLVGLGFRGGEFFYNAGNATGSPFTRTGDSFGVGCGGAASGQFGIGYIAQTDDYLVFEDAAGAVYMMDGGSPKEITTASVKRVIGDMSNGSVTITSAWGKRYVHISRASAYSFLYDIELGVWSESGFTDRIMLSGGSDSASITAEDCSAIDTVGTGGKVYTFDLSTPVYQDDGASYTMTIQSGRLDLGKGRSVTIHEARLDSDIQASGTATFATSSDDAQNFTTIGTFDMTALNPRINRCGYYPDGILNFKITHSDNTAFRASTLRLKYSVGAH